MKLSFYGLILSFCTLLAVVPAYEERSLLEKQADLPTLKMELKKDRSWVPFPAYEDREGWKKILGDTSEEYIKRGERQLDYPWQVVKATDYLEFERSGNRDIMQKPFGDNNSALSALLLAELAEGEGRFIDQIINGVFHACEMTSWALSAHLSAQKTRRSLPDYTDQVIDLTSGETSAMLSWIHYFLKAEMDKVDPVISSRIKYEINRRTLEPYLKDGRYWWMALNSEKGSVMVNNWNPWCNYNVLQSFLLMEDDPDVRAEGVYKTMLSVDRFLDYVKSDGACEEGPAYWSHAAGKLYEYLALLNESTGGKINLFTHQMIRNMGEYIARSYVGNGWVVNFADASAKGGGDAGLIFQYGKAVNSPVMKGFAGLLQEGRARRAPRASGILPTLQWIRFKDEIQSASPDHGHPPFTWYPETEFCYMYEPGNGFFLAAKGGHNAESHNHNDVGTFSLYVRNTPMIIDAGVGTYTRQTFSGERYNIWTMVSEYHNLPVINGKGQSAGRKYHSDNAGFDEATKTFSLDIASAYNENAQVKSWIRSFTQEKNKVTLTERYQLREIEEPIIENFLTSGEPDTTTPGKVVIKKEEKTLTLSYDKSLFTASVQEIVQEDPRLSRVWGEKVYRLSLTALKKELEGEFTFIFE